MRSDTSEQSIETVPVPRKYSRARARNGARGPDRAADRPVRGRTPLVAP